jgi:hypothetical protein
VLSVGGARPDVETARKYGLRYVHIPVGYDGITQEQAIHLAKAVRDLPGPVYIHCHHGKHRGPAAAAVVRICLDGNCPVERALADMRRAGTDPHYTGLYAALRKTRWPTAEELDRLPADFPAVAPVADLAQRMAAIDGHFDNLKLAQGAGWNEPPGHPDVSPAHEALQLFEQFREAIRLPETMKRPEEFRRRLSEAEVAAQDLEQRLRAIRRDNARRATAVDHAFQRTASTCIGCHTRYRDMRQEQ